MLSEDTYLLLEIIGKSVFNIYERGDKDRQGTVTFKLDESKSNVKFPHLL